MYRTRFRFGLWLTSKLSIDSKSVDNILKQTCFQMYCESALTTLKVMNQCRIPLCWHIELTTDLLRIIDGPELLEPVSDTLITVERMPSPPGYFNEKLYLEVNKNQFLLISP